MTQDEIRDYIVCINGGSGVIFQPADETFSYILTANHIFDDIDSAAYNGRVKINYFSSADNSFTEIDELELIVDNNYFPHPDVPKTPEDKQNNRGVDIAILKVPRIPARDKLIRKEQINIDTDGYCLVGLPKLRRGKNQLISQNWFRPDNGVQITTPREFKRREANLGNNQNKAELEGSSGGGIVKIFGENLLIAGIQSQVVNLDEVLGNIEFTPIHVFDEIVEGYADLLEPIFPCYLKSFSFLEDDTFKLDGDLLSNETIENITKVLRSQIVKITGSDYTPLCIKEYLKPQMLISGQTDDILSSKKLWLVWLELLTIIEIVESKNYKKADFEKLFGQIRLLYSETEKDFWVEHLNDISKTNFANLVKGGMVVVSSKRKPSNEFYILDKNSIPDDIQRVRFGFEAASATRPYGVEDINIGVGSNFPFDLFKFVHLEYFKQKLLVEEYTDFSKKTFGEIIILLREKYEKLIRIQ